MPTGGLQRLRMSRKNHTTGREQVKQQDISGLRGTGTRNGSVLRTKDTPSDPGNRFRPFLTTDGKYEQFTDPPKAMEMVNHGKEGPPRSSNDRKKH